MTRFPASTYIWLLHQDALIMQKDISIEGHIMGTRLDEHMLRELPIIPSGTIVRTSGSLRSGDVNIVLSQDVDSLAHESMIIRSGTWAEYFLDAWFDPLYRTYNFEKHELHALVSFPSIFEDCDI